MPWQEVSVVSLRTEFVTFAQREGANISELCRRFGISRRRGRLDPAESQQRLAWQRFEHPTPNALWQMDFKGHFPLHRGQCHPLTVLDDHSRFALGLEACGRQTGTAIQPRLAQIFERYGLPDSILTDNGAPVVGDQKRNRHTDLDMAYSTGHPSDSMSSVSPPDPGEGRTLSPHPESGADRLPSLEEPGPVSA